MRAANIAESYIRLSMRCYGDVKSDEYKMGDTGEPPEFLRFYLNGDPQLVFPLYEMIFNQASAVEFRPRETPLGNKTMMTFTNLQLKLPDPVILPAE